MIFDLHLVLCPLHLSLPPGCMHHPKQWENTNKNKIKLMLSKEAKVNLWRPFGMPKNCESCPQFHPRVSQRVHNRSDRPHNCDIFAVKIYNPLYTLFVIAVDVMCLVADAICWLYVLCIWL